MSSNIVGVLLAAGLSTRFGTDKRLHPLEDGTPMAVASARTLRAALPDVIAVVDDMQSEAARLLAKEGLYIVANPRATEGMGTSIACGVAKDAAAQGWIIALADMPYVPVEVIHALVERLKQGADIVAPVYRGRRGHPVGFAARHAEILMRLTGDEGARGILAANSATLELVDVREQGVILDIDEPTAVRASAELKGR